MRREGNRNFGVWNPPTGMDSVRRSVQVDFELIVRLNDLNANEGKGFDQGFGVESLKFKSPDMNLIFSLNDDNRKVFAAMTRQGWGGF